MDHILTMLNDAFRQLLSNPSILMAFGVVCFTAIGLPYAVLYVFRLWRHVQMLGVAATTPQATQIEEGWLKMVFMDSNEIL